MSATPQMEVAQGELIEVSGRRVGEPARLGEVLEVLGSPGRHHFRVRWEDGHESIIYPGEATTIKGRSTTDPEATVPDLAAPAQLLVDILRSAEIEFEVLRHRRTMTASAEARALGLLSQSVAKTVLARDPEGIHVRAVVPASRRVSTSKLAAAVSAPTVELLTEPELVSAYPQFELGAVPPFGGPGGDRVVVDRTLLEEARVVFEAGAHDVALRIRTDDLITVADAEIADIAAG
jgi:Ala-tRNA(Pro) deacylase